MLASDYFVKVNMAGRKFSGPQYRYKTVRELIDGYDHPVRNIMESSRMLLDAARLMGLVDRKADNAWKFTDLKDIPLGPVKEENPEATALAEDVRDKIDSFSKRLFTDFKSFEVFWIGQKFVDVQDYLDAFYCYVPYVKLGVDDEAEVKSLESDNISELKRGLARQAAVIRRMNEVFLKNTPDDIPESVRESLVDFALRVEDESIPL